MLQQVWYKCIALHDCIWLPWHHLLFWWRVSFFTLNQTIESQLFVKWVATCPHGIELPELYISWQSDRHKQFHFKRKLATNKTIKINHNNIKFITNKSIFYTIQTWNNLFTQNNRICYWVVTSFTDDVVSFFQHYGLCPKLNACQSLLKNVLGGWTCIIH